MDESVQRCYPRIKTLWDFYQEVWKPFGELLTDMEQEGFYVDWLEAFLLVVVKICAQ